MPQPPCPLDDCPFPDLGCDKGHDDPARECAVYREATPAPALPADDQADELPWSGGVLGSADLTGIAALSRPRLIGVVGLSDAGKSSVLSRLYLLLTHGHGFRGRTFAGSRTLHGWEALAIPGRWPPHGVGPGFPEHTTSLAGEPGLLHLALRRDDGGREDVLITDAPGEWFRDWAKVRTAPAAKGARWIADHADAAVLFIDSDALSGEDRGTARADLVKLIRRTGEAFANRRVVVLWAKSDVEVPTAMRTQIESQVARHLSGQPVLDVTVCPEEWTEAAVRGVFAVFEALLDGPTESQGASARRRSPLSLPSVDTDDPLLSFRGHAP